MAAALRSDVTTASFRLGTRLTAGHGLPVKSLRKRKRSSAIAPNKRDREPTAKNLHAGTFLDETIAIWQPRTSRRLTREDARQIIENMTGFFNVLREWDRAERVAAGKPAPSDASQPPSECG